MKRAFIVGIDGKMGKMLCEVAPSYGYTVVGGFDVTPDPARNVVNDMKDVKASFDVIIDFSRPQTLSAIVYLVERSPAPVVLATTGYNDSELMTVRLLAQKVPVFRSANMSIGVAAAKAAAIAAQKVLGPAFDIEIVEKHHNRKVDSPSGTALLLAEALTDRNNIIFARDGKRAPAEVGIVSVRGGGVVGEHEIGFYGEDEIVTVSHSARSRRLFAAGAYRAADFISGRPPAVYTMDDLVAAIAD